MTDSILFWDSQPGDTVRRRMQTDGMLGEKRLYANSWNCLYLVLKNEGMQTVFAGLTANIVRGIPGAAIQFWAYDAMKAFFNI